MAQAGRPKKLTEEDIAKAIIKLGIDKVTFAELAKYLNVGQATIYRYLPNHAAIQRCASNYIFSDVQWEQSDTWQHTIAKNMQTLYKLMENYPGLSMALEGAAWGDNVYRALDELIDLMKEHIEDGFTASLITETLFGMVIHYYGGWEITNSKTYSESKKELNENLRQRMIANGADEEKINEVFEQEIAAKHMITRRAGRWMIDGIALQLERDGKLRDLPHDLDWMADL